MIDEIELVPNICSFCKCTIEKNYGELEVTDEHGKIYHSACLRTLREIGG